VLAELTQVTQRIGTEFHVAY